MVVIFCSYRKITQVVRKVRMIGSINYTCAKHKQFEIEA